VTTTTRTPRASTPVTTPSWWRALAGVEVALAAVAVVADLLLPALVLVVMAALSLAVRRQRPGTLGFHRPARPGRLALTVLGLTVAWTAVQFLVVTPLVEALTGSSHDVSDLAEVEGDAGLLLLLVVASWTLAALGEETAFRGYLLTRVTDACGGPGRAATVVAVLVSSLLFGLIHTEQGLAGVVITAVDGVFLAVLRLRLDGGVWASVLAHGFNNTLGLTVFFLVGPVAAPW
jgi:membrane protease YdiL (CAAX protease family)